MPPAPDPLLLRLAPPAAEKLVLFPNSLLVKTKTDPPEPALT